MLGLILLIKGSDYLVEASCIIADRMKIPALIVGLTIVAFGTSAPELFVSTGAALKGNADISIGNVVGSNIFNIVGIISIAAIITEVKLNKQIIFREMPIMLFSLVIFYVFSLDGNISRIEGGILFFGIIAYLVSVYINSKKQSSLYESEENNYKKWGTLICILVIMASLVSMVLGSNLIVENATFLAKSIGVSDFIISVTIIAIGTSLPELATTFSAAKRGQADLAVGNAVGSNIFNVFSVIGITALITPLKVSKEILQYDFIVMLLIPILIWPVMVYKKKVGKTEGVLMLLAYSIYVFFLVS